ncbi:MAG: hypothetical protein EHM23_22235 [Acidobacteria bacterium]|nr:MAG: hypothetical protein EHM23_22235 [Acidobacteriota bacterium]
MLKRLCWWVVLPILGLGGCYLLLLNFPQPLFRWSDQSDNLRLYSDQPFQPEAGRELLRSVQRKLALSPLYSNKSRYSVFICNAPWRRVLFFMPAPGAGGANYHPWTSNVFLISAAIEDNRLVNRSGKPDMLGRRLDHFMTHEITHGLTAREAGWWRHQRLPDWIKEGYAEYVARGAEFDYEQSVAAFLAGAPEMSLPKAAPYRRYETLVAFWVKNKGGIRRLLTQPRSQTEAEATLRAAAGARRQ